LLKPKLVATILHDPIRWRILRELCKGEALPVIELAIRARTRPTKVSKHMAVLRKAGLVTTHYGRLYRLAPVLTPDLAGQRLDLGHCVLKLDTDY